MNLDVIQSYLKAYYPALTFIIALVVIAVGIEMGFRLPPTIVQYGTVLLVLVTLATVLQNGQLVKNASEERELNRDLLIEQQKGAIIQLIILGIDELESELSSDWERLEDVSKEDDKVVLPPLSDDFELPTHRMVSEIERSCPNIVDDLERYKEERDTYMRDYTELKSDLLEELPEGLSDEQRSILINGIIENNSIIRSERRAVAIFPSVVESIVRGAFGASSAYGWRNDATKGWVSDNWSEVREVFLSIQDDPNYSERFSMLYTRGERLVNMNTMIHNKLYSGRSDFKETYNILESEIASKKE